MSYTPDLQRVVDQLKLKKENILYLTIKNIYLDDMREVLKNVEYRENTVFFRRKLFVKGKDGKPSQEMKPLKCILFQGGYEPDSPRVLISLKGWTVDRKKFPDNLDINGHDIDYGICLVLSDILYDSQNGMLYRDLPKQKKSPKTQTEGRINPKPRKKKKTLAEKKGIRVSKIIKKRF